MDGVMLDSEKLYVRFWCEAGQFYGFPMETKHALGIRSMARPFAIAKLRGWFGDAFDYDKVRDKRVELMSAHIAAHGIEAKQGADTLLRWLKQSAWDCSAILMRFAAHGRCRTASRRRIFISSRQTVWAFCRRHVLRWRIRPTASVRLRRLAARPCWCRIWTTPMRS